MPFDLILLSNFWGSDYILKRFIISSGADFLQCSISTLFGRETSLLSGGVTRYSFSVSPIGV